MTTLDLRKLKVLVAVAKTRSATIAGQQLHIGQSAVSQTLKEIQEELGIVLFERVGRGLMPTAAGEKLAAEGQRVLAALTRTNTVASALQRGEQNEIVVGVMTAFIHGEIARCIARFSTRHQHLSLGLETHDRNELIERVLNGKLDIAVVIGGIREPGIKTFATIAMRVVCITPKGHPLAQLTAVRERDLMAYRQIILTRDSPLRMALEAAGIATNKQQHYGTIRAGTQRAIVTMVEMGAGVALVDPLVLAENDQIEVLTFEPAIHVNLSMFARDDWANRTLAHELGVKLYQALAHLSGDANIQI